MVLQVLLPEVLQRGYCVLARQHKVVSRREKHPMEKGGHEYVERVCRANIDRIERGCYTVEDAMSML